MARAGKPSRTNRSSTRSYQRHGLHSLESALGRVSESWIEELGDVGAALRVWRDALIADLGGEDRVSTQQRAIVDLACRTYLMLQHVDNYILGEKALVNKRSRKLHPVVLHRQRLADSFAKYLDMLGLERRGDVHDLSEYVRSKYGAED